MEHRGVSKDIPPKKTTRPDARRSVVTVLTSQTESRAPIAPRSWALFYFGRCPEIEQELYASGAPLFALKIEHPWGVLYKKRHGVFYKKKTRSKNKYRRNQLGTVPSSRHDGAVHWNILKTHVYAHSWRHGAPIALGIFGRFQK